MALLLKIVVYAAALWVAVYAVPGLEFDGNWLTLGLIALIFAGVNAVMKPIVTVLSLPFIIVTLGLFLLVVNAVMLAVTIWISGIFGLGLTSTGFGATFIGAIVVAIVAWFGEAITKR
jgi:putative membrane protein